jgi:hypothetical protein
LAKEDAFFAVRQRWALNFKPQISDLKNYPRSSAFIRGKRTVVSGQWLVVS